MDNRRNWLAFLAICAFVIPFPSQRQAPVGIPKIGFMA
jgi:hypothetical protein